MFNSKQQQLFKVEKQQKTSGNAFLKAAGKHSARTVSGNGALKYSTTGNTGLDQFAKLGEYKSPRSYADVSRDMSILWAENPISAVKLTLFIRTITRKVNIVGGNKTESVQRGSGLKHESILRMLWIAINHPNVFWKNILLFISVGSWKDIIQMLSYDLQYNGWKNRALDWDKMGKILLTGLGDTSQSELLKKYLPQIKAKSKCTTLESQADTMIAKWICSLVFGEKESGATYKKYRKLKVSGTAHEWQQLISQRKFKDIEFYKIAGRALQILVNSKFLANQGLESKYDKWIESQPIAKYTGYPHELFSKMSTRLTTPLQKQYQIKTLNAQFMCLVKTAQDGANKNTGLIVVRDTSGSMTSEAAGTNMSAFAIAKALALFFSYMLPEGAFADSWIEFNSDAKLHTWRGSTPYEKMLNDTTSYVGDTNFQSVIDLFCRMKLQGVAEDQFPSGILCLSDGEFNATDCGSTNVEKALAKLRIAGFSQEYRDNFKIILWNIRSNFYKDSSTKFETFGDHGNVFYLSGYDGSIVSFITGTDKQESTPKSADELYEAALNQEVLNMVSL